MKNTITDGLLHVHLQSPQDTGSLMEDFFIRMKELNCPAVTVTEHGTLTSLYDAVALGEKYGIKVIPGVEAYLEDELGKRSHFILYAMDNKGFKDLSNIVTESFKKVEKIGKLQFPYTSIDLLKKYSGHIIGTSACIEGPISKILQTNTLVEEKIAKLKKKAGSNPETSQTKKQRKELMDLKESLKEKRTQKNTLSAQIKKKSFDGDLQKTEKQIEALAEEILDISTKVSKLTKELKTVDEKIKVYENIQTQISQLREKMASEEEIFNKAVKKALYFQNIFGKGKFFIELQNHGIEMEEKIYPILAKIAQVADIPVVAANDVHIATNSEEDIKRRQIMKSTKFNQWEEISVGDDQLYIKDDEQLQASLMKIIPEEIVEKAMKNIGYIVRKCNVTFEKETHYPKFPVPKGMTAESFLEAECRKGIKRLFKEEEWTTVYEERLVYELSVINAMGFADYHLTEADFLNFGRKLGKMPSQRFLYLKEHMKEMSLKEMISYVEKDQSEIGMFIGPGRGSANGSLVCLCLGITAVDPIKYNLLFERFLNVERVTMPDIDSDIATEARDVLIEYVRKKFGEDAVCCIATKGVAQAKGAVRAYARVKESIKQDKKYSNKGDEIAKKIPKEVTKLEKCIDKLKEEYKKEPLALEIIENALLIEGQLMNFGMHAGGVIIADNRNVGEYVPLMWDTQNNVWKCQCDMVQAEERGLLKFDFLGLTTLSIITETARLVKKRTGKTIDLLNIPFEKEVFKNIYSRGKTNAVFQFESSGMKQMLMQFQPESFEDIILLIAAYRPGPMDYIPGIIRSKMLGEKPKYCIPEIGQVLDVTYGYTIYQEQLMDIFHKFAGFSLGDADIIRRYMSKKKPEKFMQYKEPFVNGLIKNGAEKEGAEKLWDEFENFAKYAFNKSHAAAYALVSYITAYLKYHYPVEFVVANLNSYDDPKKLSEKIPRLIADLPKGVKLLSPDINASERGFSISKTGDILFGLSNIKYVGSSADMIIDKRPYMSFKDFLEKGHTNKGVTEALIIAGALDCFCGNRQAMLSSLEKMTTLLKTLCEKEKKEAEYLEKIEIVKTSKNPLADLKEKGWEYKKIPTIKSLEGPARSAKDVSRKAKEEFHKEMLPIHIKEVKKERLAQEKNFLGMYVSESPLDEYKTPTQLGCVNISDVTKGVCRIMGIIENVRISHRKADGKEIAFFTLEDKSGSINVNCFTEAYEKYKSVIMEGEVLAIEGNVHEEIVLASSEEEEDTVVYTITVKKTAPVKPNRPYIVMHIKHIGQWIDNQEYIKDYEDPNGYPLLVDILMEDKYRKTTLTVAESILRDNLLSTSILS